MEAAKKRNQVFQYMEAIGILMVIDDHTGTNIGIMSGLFPYNSFYMPMFVFISGYFYKEQPVLTNLKHKTQHLLIPYLIWGYVGDLIAYILTKAGIVDWFVNPFDLRNTAISLTLISLSPVTDPSWFVVMLFWVSIFYNVIRRVLRINKKWKDYAFTAAAVIAGFILLYLCLNGYESNLTALFFIRTFWYMQFYHLGVMFKRYWESYVSRWRTVSTLVTCILVNAVLLCIFGEDIRFNSTAWMASFHSWWLPLVTSGTGIVFWYKTMEFLSARAGQLKAVDFIAENTFTIMCTHFLLANIPNFYVHFKYRRGNPAFADFPGEAFRQNIWNGYGHYATGLAGFFCGLLGSLLVIWLMKKARGQFAKTRKKTL